MVKFQPNQMDGWSYVNPEPWIEVDVPPSFNPFENLGKTAPKGGCLRLRGTGKRFMRRSAGGGLVSILRSSKMEPVAQRARRHGAAQGVPCRRRRLKPTPAPAHRASRAADGSGMTKKLSMRSVGPLTGPIGP